MAMIKDPNKTATRSAPDEALGNVVGAGRANQMHVVHAFYILIRDVDCSKAHIGDADYKYKNRERRLAAMDSLIKQYNLQHTSRTFGGVAMLTAQKLLRAFMSATRPHRVKSFEHFWISGSELISGEKFEAIQRHARDAQTFHGCSEYDPKSTVWKFSEIGTTATVLEAPSGVTFTDAVASPGPSSPQTRHSSQSWTTSTTLPTDQSGSTNDLIDESVVLAEMLDGRRKRLRLSSPESNPSSLTEGHGLERIEAMMDDFSNLLGGFVRHLFKHFRLDHHMTGLFDPRITQCELTSLYQLCWGPEWQEVGEEIRGQLTAPDLVQSLVSAYLYHNILQSTGWRWSSLRKDMHSCLLDKSAKKDILNQRIASVLMKPSPQSLPYLHDYVDQLWSNAIGREEKRAELSRIFVDDFFNAFEPLIGQLRNVAQCMTPEKIFGDWKTEVKEPLLKLTHQAQLLRLHTEPTRAQQFTFLLPKHGLPCDRNTMESKGPPRPHIETVVLASVTPGVQVESQSANGPKRHVLRPARVIERLRNRPEPETKCPV